METVITLKPEAFQRTAVGKYIWAYFSSSKHWKEEKRIIIETRHRWKDKGPIWQVFNAVLLSLRNDGVTKIIIK